MDAEINSQQQELNNYERVKNTNKTTTNQWLTTNNKLKQDIKENRELMCTLRETNLAQTAELDRAETLSINQAKLITELIAARVELRRQLQTLHQSLEGKSSDVVTLQGICQSNKDNLMVSEQTAANLREDILALEKTIEEDESALSKGWQKISSQNGGKSNADRYEQLWKKSTNARKLEQESMQAVLADLDAAQETINTQQTPVRGTRHEYGDRRYA